MRSQISRKEGRKENVDFEKKMEAIKKEGCRL